MDKPVLWITRKLSANVVARAQRDYHTIVEFEDIPASAEKIIEMSSKVDAILPCHSEKFTQKVVERLSNRLKIIANYSVGVDHCDLAALSARGITVTNTPDVLSDATAEIAMLLLLGAARRAVEGDHLVRSGRWQSWSPAFMVGHQVTGKRLGIIGMGRVGQVVARRAAGFAMEIHYHNRRKLDVELAHNAIYHPRLETLLNVSDCLSLHCPATSATERIMNTETFSMLPDGAIFVNCARGSLVDEAALVQALNTGKIAAAGLDCFQVEPGGNSTFATHNNIFMLPHIGSATLETRDAMGYRALDNLDAFFSGQVPQDQLV